MIAADGATLDQSRSALAAILLFALVLVVVLTALAAMLLFLHRRRQRSQRRPSAVEQVDAWREAGRRVGTLHEGGPSREEEM